jgi:hypothetical protein
MTRNEANAYLAAILETIAELPNGAPSGHLYAALMGRLELTDYQALVGIAKDAGLVQERGHLLTMTPKGREMVAKITAVRAG